MKKYIAELIGTFALTLAVALSLAGSFPVSTPVIAALTLGLFVYSISHISGTHINPAVTIGAWFIKKINFIDALFYIVFQILGAILAIIVSHLMITATSLTVSSSLPTLFAELLGTFFFTFGIASVIYNKTPSVMSGIVIGGSLLLGISVASILSNGVLNPAVALGINSFSLAYVFGPIFGSILGMSTYKILSREK